jgi:hypothetical protein
MKLVKKSKSPESVQEKPKYTDLRQVMDYKRDFSMFYSGVEHEAYLDGCYNMGIRNFLMSYEYLRTKGAKQIKKYSDIHLFIDSGAFTYMNDPKYQDFTVEQWEEQIQGYLSWAKKHKDSIFGMAELDLQNLLGYEVIDQWRRKYFEPFMLETGIPVCFIYHLEGKEIWDKMCQRYPYVGFSTVSDEDSSILNVSELKEMLRVAEKHNALVHGFGMTRTSLLPELPYYTVDSTSWKAGFRFGQLAIWNGKKVQMFRKEDWETKAFKYLDNYPDLKLDKELLYSYYEPEVLKANVYAYMRAEEFIIDRLKPLTYWKKPKTTKTDINNLPDDFFPTQEWFDSGETEGLKDYCLKCNLNPEYADARNILYDITAFSTWGDDAHSKMHEWYSEEAQESLLNELHDTFVNRIVPDKETKIQDLKEFFLSCIAGENDKLLHLGTNFDRTVKERESYIEEEETELREITTNEVKQLISNLNLLPGEEGTPEIDELDEEIFRKAEIIPTFDEKGKFVKGQVAVRKPKQVYSNKYPKYACDTCFAAAKCPEFKSGYVCAYNKMFNRFNTRDMGDIIQAMQGIVDHNMNRMQRSMLMETINGTIDPVTSQLMDTNIRYLQMLKQMYENGSPEVLKQTKVVRADGTEETTTSITNPQGGGIMEKLLGSMMSSSTPEKSEDKVVDAEYKEKGEGE